MDAGKSLVEVLKEVWIAMRTERLARGREHTTDAKYESDKNVHGVGIRME